MFQSEIVLRNDIHHYTIFHVYISYFIAVKHTKFSLTELMNAKNPPMV